VRPSNSAQMKRATGAGRRQRCVRAVIAALALSALSALGLAAPGAAAASSAPSVSTGTAKSVSYASATLAGSINPHGEDTSYFFQFGLSKTYGLQTGIADAGHGASTVNVSMPVTGLQPNTKYHFRLIAINASGASNGRDSYFTTKKIPLSLAILVAPNPVAFGGTIFVEGTLSGTGNGGVGVQLQSNPFPYLQGFVNVGNPELTMPNGAFTFPVLGLGAATQFRVVTVSGHRVVSPIALESVSVDVTSHISRARRRHFARFSGIVTPAEDGAEVGILKIVHGRGVPVAGARLRHRDAASSSYSREVRVGPGAYRVLVRVVNGAQISNYGRTLIIR
jgi:hypothetical protein